MEEHIVRRAFVTGGSGFVGRNLIAYLRKHGIEVRALIRSKPAQMVVEELGAETVQGDLSDEQALISGMRGCDVVFHLAAWTQDWGDETEAYRINVLGTEQVIAAARTAAVPRLVHVSTEAVLLDGTPMINVDETRPRPKHLLGLYSRTKALAEAYAQQANSHELEVIIVRPRFVWGQGDTSVLRLLVDMVRSKSYSWIDHGRYLTSTCHVLNVCEGMLLAAQKGRAGEIYFLTDGAPVEFRSFITALLHTQGLTPGKRNIPYWLARVIAAGGEWFWRTFRLSGSPPLTRSAVHIIGAEVTVSDAKARRELGYIATVSRDVGLAEMELH